VNDPGRVFAALADPHRRFLVEALATRESATPTELASELPVTRQAVSKHLAALADAGLVAPARAGRETRYRLTPAPLDEATAWIEQVGSAWDERLAALARHLGR
jgi:DNA-binding transcriptional ArsR family regulator